MYSKNLERSSSFFNKNYSESMNKDIIGNLENYLYPKMYLIKLHVTMTN